MAQRKQVRLAEMKVGIFVTIALIVLATFILQQSWGINWFSGSAKAVTYLPDVGGLKPGAPVWLAGIEIGRVSKVSIVPPELYSGNSAVFREIDEIKRQIDSVDPKMPSSGQIILDLEEQIRNLKIEIRMVEVQLDISPQYLNRISEDSEVSIQSRGLIGDSFIDISPGTYGAPPKKQGDFYLIEGIQRPGFREIMTGANDVVANFGVLAGQFRNIAMQINPEKVGTELASTVRETQSLLRRIDDTFARASLLIDDLHRGEGTFGQIVSDPQLYQQLTESLGEFNKVAQNVQNGSGTIPKLINDPALFDATNATLKKADLVMDRVVKGQGTLGKLSSDAELYDRTKVALERLASLVEQIEKGEGTLGKLLKEPSLYNNLDQSTAEIAKLIYDLRQDPKKYLTIRFRLF